MKKKFDFFQFAAPLLILLYLAWTLLDKGLTILWQLEHTGLTLKNFPYAYHAGFAVVVLSFLIMAVGLLIKKNRVILLAGTGLFLVKNLYSTVSSLPELTKILVVYGKTALDNGSLTWEGYYCCDPTLSFPSSHAYWQLIQPRLESVLVGLLLVLFGVLVLVSLLRKKPLPTFLKALTCWLPGLYLLISCLSHFDLIINFHLSPYSLMLFGARFYLADTLLPFLPLIEDTLFAFVLIFFAGSVLKKENCRHRLPALLVGGGGMALMVLSNTVSLFIAVISTLLYDRVYYFDGYWFTIVFWVLSFLMMILGVLLAPTVALSFQKKETP